MEETSWWHFKIYWFCSLFYELLSLSSSYVWYVKHTDRKTLSTRALTRSLGPTSSMLLSTLALLFPFAGQYLFDNVDCRLFVSLMNGRWLLSETEIRSGGFFFIFITPLSPARSYRKSSSTFYFRRKQNHFFLNCDDTRDCLMIKTFWNEHKKGQKLVIRLTPSRYFIFIFW